MRDVPEGDTTHRTAAALRTALTGKVVTRFDAPRLVGPKPTPGRMIEAVESHGKHLEIIWDDGLILHTHMRMTGSWHLYRTGERWRKPSHLMRATIVVPEWIAVCFNAPTVETYRAFDRHRHPGLGRLGPDLCDAEVDLNECVERMLHHPEPETPVAEVLLDQHVACGVGNVYRCEILWACELHPMAPVGDMSVEACRRVIATAAQMLQANLHHSARITTSSVPGGLAVYGRNGQRCARCGDTIAVRRAGEHARLLYSCPGCQVRLDPAYKTPPKGIDREMDPHPAAAKFLADLPWRRDPLAG